MSGPGRAKEGRSFHLPTVALWTCLGALIIATSALALQAGAEAMYLVVTGWIVGPFFLYWLYRKVRSLRGSRRV
ncbi:MAG: hypothetical protein ACUVV6_00885 [Thermoplasmatota archaeon]